MISLFNPAKRLFTVAQKPLRMSNLQIEQRVSDLINQSRSALSRTITLIESQRQDHRKDADRIMN